MESEKRRVAQLLADLSRIDARLDQIKEKPDWKEVEIREEKQVTSSPARCRTLNPLRFVAFAEFQAASWDGRAAPCPDQSLGDFRFGE